MKITIDLNDPEIQAQINAQVDARLNMIAAERIQSAFLEYQHSLTFGRS